MWYIDHSAFSIMVSNTVTLFAVSSCMCVAVGYRIVKWYDLKQRELVKIAGVNLDDKDNKHLEEFINHNNDDLEVMLGAAMFASLIFGFITRGAHRF